ncbi:hypothetical protein FHP25_08285 [Vineibacter terrae]|uniref:Uncharacterized protein n=1 Tax=Vineibacter terrae TaxID=2586908 RepID=A0A5C8PQU7_9HYPH|nr:hypothetical protein [Vineibacter terrae]TXL78187.1 hypothetical protein FHP25_08285 [Vineibacter terrae]
MTVFAGWNTSPGDDVLGLPTSTVGPVLLSPWNSSGQQTVEKGACKALLRKAALAQVLSLNLHSQGQDTSFCHNVENNLDRHHVRQHGNGT